MIPQPDAVAGNNSGDTPDDFGPERRTVSCLVRPLDGICVCLPPQQGCGAPHQNSEYPPSMTKVSPVW